METSDIPVTFFTELGKVVHSTLEKDTRKLFGKEIVPICINRLLLNWTGIGVRPMQWNVELFEIEFINSNRVEYESSHG